jgi:hypothetical protein
MWMRERIREAILLPLTHSLSKRVSEIYISIAPSIEREGG